MRNKSVQPMAAVIKEYLKAMGIDKRMQEVNLIKQWENVIGVSVANMTRELYIRHGVLFVRIDSAVVRNELSMLKQGIIQALNNKAGGDVISDIVFTI